MRDFGLDRLLRSAAKIDEPATSAPFGFDVRVVALWRESGGAGAGTFGELTGLARRIVVTAMIVTVFSGIGAYWEVTENEEAAEPSTNAYAIADTAIDAVFFQ